MRPNRRLELSPDGLFPGPNSLDLSLCGMMPPKLFVPVSGGLASRAGLTFRLTNISPEVFCFLRPFFFPSRIFIPLRGCLNNEYLLERFEKFFTICYAVFDMRTGLVRYSNAAHPLPVLVRREGCVVSLTDGEPSSAFWTIPSRKGKFGCVRGLLFWSMRICHVLFMFIYMSICNCAVLFFMVVLCCNCNKCLTVYFFIV